MSQTEIDEFFAGNYEFGTAIYGQAPLQTAVNATIIFYILTLIILLGCLHLYLGLNAHLIYVFSILQVSGEFYFGEGYYFVPTSTLPFYRTILYTLLLYEVYLAIKRSQSNLSFKGKSRQILALVPYLAFIGIGSRNSFMVDEINQIMSEALTISLINLTLSMSVYILVKKVSKFSFLPLLTLGFLVGIVFTARLATLYVGFLVLLIIARHFRKFEKYKSILFSLIVSVSIPTLILNLSGLNSEQSQTWYGPVAYGIEFQVLDPKKLDLSPDARELLDTAIEIRAELQDNSSSKGQVQYLIYEPVGNNLYGAAIPAASKLGFTSESNDRMGELFREIAVASWTSHPTLVFRVIAENILVSLGLYKNEEFGQFLKVEGYVGLSKVFISPFPYFLILIQILLSRRSRIPEYTRTLVYLFFLFFVGNCIVVAIFNGPIVRYTSLIDPYMLLAVTLLHSLIARDNRYYRPGGVFNEIH